MQVMNDAVQHHSQIASPVSAAPNNQFQVAIYADNNGTPGALIASSPSQTIVPDAWNTVPIAAAITANSYYRPVYNTDGLAGNANNLRSDSGGMMSWLTPESFCTWTERLRSAKRHARRQSIHLRIFPIGIRPDGIAGGC
jgi:hypothetical protein